MHTVSSLAGLLRISEEQVLAHIRAGRLRAVNVGGGTVKPRWRISEDQLNEFLASRTATPPAPRPARRKRSSETIQFYS
jgi:excisionase family DNA binding protein